MRTSDQSKRAKGHLAGWVGGVAFDSTRLTLLADAYSDDFVIQARWTDGGERELTFYIPERGSERKVYTFAAAQGAGAYYEITGERSMEWEGGTVTREKTEFSAPDPNQWRAMIGFNFEVSIDDQTVWIKGEGELIGASPWNRDMRERFQTRKG
ncbi:hypothetical protein J2W43_001043 [Pseudomonas brassicacearum]|uniref:Uncharacterized protein n=1 Tax=Pseudomonas brassicacearum TaxID=930166 RepID=A0AAW8M561_9PSED|nr:hypothetical protein [Pseudomonas brassicacearum]MDR6957067.1 hypothetical protein [Pseudomonas brassicacearum]